MADKYLISAEHHRITNADAILAANQELYDNLYFQISEVARAMKAGKSNSVMKCLVHYFPVEMAELVVLLTLEPKTAEQVAQESGKPVEYVKEVLDRYWQRGLAGTTRAFVDEKGYTQPRSWSLVLGEFPFCDGAAGTYKYFDEDEEKEVGMLLSKIYFEEGWLQQWGNFQEPPYMILVDERQVDDPSTMEDWEKGSEHILQTNQVGVTRCACRTRHGLYNKCNHVLEKSMIDTCIQFDALMAPYIDRGAGKWTTKEDALEVLWYGLDAGLVGLSDSTPVIAGASTFICQCCPDCCHILGTWTKAGLKTGFVKSNFDPKFDLHKCTFEDEMLCVKACPVPSAMWYHPPTKRDRSDEFIGVNPDLCIGCGLCATMCPQKAIKMVKVRNWVPKPKDPTRNRGTVDFLSKAPILEE